MRRLTPALLLMSFTASAGISGHVSVQGQAASLLADTPNGGEQVSSSALLQENLGIHYAGMPFGPAVLLLTGGIEAMNVNGWSAGGAQVSGRSATLDVSVGLLPRRSVPVRVFARATLADGSPQSFATLGGGESVLYGLGLNLEPGAVLPGLRLEAQEHRFTGPHAGSPLGDVRRLVTASTFRAFGEHQVSLGLRVEQELHPALGQWLGFAASGAWISPRHQTTVLYTQFDRDFVLPSLPTGQSTTERNGRLAHVQRLTPSLLAEASARISETRFAAAAGTLGGGGLGVTWKPLEAHDLLVSASGDVGVTRTVGGAGVGDGNAVGGGVRAGYARPLGVVKVGAVVGAGANGCSCVGPASGLLSSLEGGVSVGTLGPGPLEVRGEYTLTRVGAPPGRGGDRLEHRARAFGRTRIGRADLYGSLAYDDGFREFIDVNTGAAGALHEQGFSGALGTTVAVWRGSVTAEARHARGVAVLPPTPFVLGPPQTARALTHLMLNGLLPVRDWLDVSGGGVATWTVLDVGAPLTTVSASLGLTWHFGRITAALQYSFLRSDTVGLATHQHLVRAWVTRPFEL